ncbi:uncharacterized protein LOC128210752 [Mya arenaria]|uniref:uncharacterized protein LOC128210752 n=1 Tax=Mya arenaria TaxID=6604 RepID=UPI0022E07C47|nr:uncharacterized protein LOC128210752 [Mya arenaria]
MMFIYFQTIACLLPFAILVSLVYIAPPEVPTAELPSDDIPRMDSKTNHFRYKDPEFSYQQTKEYETKFAEIFKTFPNHQNSTKYLIYFCDIECGGLGDRLKGIVKVYMLSILSRRRFGIRMKEPSDIENFLQPHVIDWRVNEAEIAGKDRKTVDYKTLHDFIAIDLETHDRDPEKVLKTDVIFMRANQDWTKTLRKLKVSPERFPQIYQHPSSDLTRIIYNGLFKPTDTLQRLVHNFFEEKVGGKKLACLHARMGESNHTRYSFDVIKTPLDFLKQYDSQPNYKIMIATDNDHVKNYSRTFFKNFIDTDFSGSIMHIDYMQNNTVDARTRETGFMHSLLDHMILARCDTLILTMSGFGVTAASLRYTSAELFVYMKNEVFPVRRELLREVFQWRCISHAKTGYVCDG